MKRIVMQIAVIAIAIIKTIIILTINNNQEQIQDKSFSKNMNQWKLLVTVGKELDLPVTAALVPSVNNNIIGYCSYRISSNKRPRRLLNFETVRCNPIRGRHFYFKIREINNVKYQHIVIFYFKIRMKYKCSLWINQI